MGFCKTVTVGAIGYVLGARAGRGRYEQIAKIASKVWQSKPVKKGRDQVKDQAAHSFQKAQEVASAKVSTAAAAVKDKVVNRGDEVTVEEIRVEPIPPVYPIN